MLKADTSSGCTARSEEEHGLPETVTSRRVEGEMSDEKGDGSCEDVSSGGNGKESCIPVPMTYDGTVRMSIWDDARILTMESSLVNKQTRSCHGISTENSTFATNTEGLEPERCITILHSNGITTNSIPMIATFETSLVLLATLVDYSPCVTSITLQLKSWDSGSTQVAMESDTQGDISGLVTSYRNGHGFRYVTELPTNYEPSPTRISGTHSTENENFWYQDSDRDTSSASSSFEGNSEKNTESTVLQQFPVTVCLAEGDNGEVVATLACRSGDSHPMTMSVLTNASCLPATLHIQVEKGQRVDIITQSKEKAAVIHIIASETLTSRRFPRGRKPKPPREEHPLTEEHIERGLKSRMETGCYRKRDNTGHLMYQQGLLYGRWMSELLTLRVSSDRTTAAIDQAKRRTERIGTTEAFDGRKTSDITKKILCLMDDEVNVISSDVSLHTRLSELVSCTERIASGVECTTLVNLHCCFAFHVLQTGGTLNLVPGVSADCIVRYCLSLSKGFLELNDEYIVYRNRGRTVQARQGCALEKVYEPLR